MFYFGIPSYKRSQQQLTLSYLLKMGYCKNDIILSTQTKDDDYIKYKNLYDDKAIIISNDGNCVSDGRNELLKFVPKGCKLVMLDDDITALQILENNKLRDIYTKEELDSFIEKAFSFAETNNARMWGVYPVSNAFFMKKTIDKKNILIGCVMGIINNDLYFDRDFTTKEDFELCCREISRGFNCVRFNFITANAKHRTNSGGCKDMWKFDINKKNADMLIARYPKLIKRNSKKLDEVRYVGSKK